MAEHKEPVYEIALDAGSHAYDIEVCLARNGSRYLRITDYRVTDDGEQPCRGVMVFDDHAQEFLWALMKALAHLDEEMYPRSEVSDTNCNSPIEEVRKRYPRAYEPWSAVEDARLRLAYEFGATNEQISRLLGRQPSAIQSRLRRLEEPI